MDKKNLYRQLLIIAIVLLIIPLVLSACANTTDITACVTNDPYGFLSGLWHGFISPFSFVISLFSDKIEMYAVNNNDGWYDFGFVLGAGILFGGGSSARR